MWCGVGTGGTIAGTSSFLKKVCPTAQCYLADCNGSMLHGYVTSCQQDMVENVDRLTGKTGTFVEGIGIKRITANFLCGYPVIDGSFTVCDAEVIEMAYYLLRCVCLVRYTIVLYVLCIGTRVYLSVRLPH